MRTGDFVFYTLQYKRTHESPWCEPDGPLTPVDEEDDWAFGSWDRFGQHAEPWHGSGNDFRPKYKKSHDETHDVWSWTSQHGWWTLDYALQGLARVTQASNAGKLDLRDGYNKRTQAVRYRFRVVRVKLSYDVQPLTDEVLAEACLQSAK